MTMKKSILYTVLLIGLSTLSSCTFEDKPDALSNELSLISPLGFKIADNIENLKKSLNLTSKATILSIRFEENDKFNAAFIEYSDENVRLGNVAIVKGMAKFSSDKISLNKHPNASGKVGGQSGEWTVSCTGCSNCRVSDTIDSSGEITFTCESSCCVMNIKEKEPPGLSPY